MLNGENQRTIILSSAYPSESNIYQSMFIHTRILAYKEAGLNVDMFQIHPHLKNGKRVYDGVNVIHGNAEFLFNILKNNNIGTVCVHFLDPYLWSVLKLFKDKIRILVWLHGYEVQPYWRRLFNHDTSQKLEQAKKISEYTMKLWNEIFNQIDNYDIHFVFVSQYFADEVFEDYKIQLPKDKYSIIHNCIDTDLFMYNPKTKEQRLKIFSIRPYASNNYANDLTVKVILQLSNKNYFHDLQFFIAGNGILFNELTTPLKHLKNVSLVNKFFEQEELAKIYLDSGIVLIPTRMDTQGVSRDEAMSCGCVPITTAVACIPEFVDETCGILAEGENVQQMVEGIDYLYHNPDKFLEMSENAAKRIRNQTSKEHTIAKEIELIK